MMTTGRGSKATSIQDFLKEEWTNEAKFAANLRLARGLAVFLGSVYVFQQFGEALFAV